MRIDEVRESTSRVNVFVDVDGRRFEFAAYMGGDVEVYDFPPSWRGAPRFVGYLPKSTGGKLFALLVREGRLRTDDRGYFHRGVPRWQLGPLGPYCAAPERPDGRAWQRVCACSECLSARRERSVVLGRKRVRSTLRSEL